jgi:uncharacterized protein (TIGR03083 family)
LAYCASAGQDAPVPSPRSTFLDAAAVVADAVDLISSTAWDGPGLGVWDLRALVGHTSRSLVTVVEYLGRPAAAVEIVTPEAYYAVVARLIGADPSAVVERGRAAGAALGDDPAAAFRARLADAAAALDGAEDDDLLTTIAGGMRLAAYLPTRTFELVVHGADIAAATSLAVTFPAEVLAEAAALAARIAVELGKGPEVLAALTGRSGLPAGFSVV